MDFANKYGHSEGAKVSDILWLCTNVISTVKVRSLMLCWFTDVADPHDKGSPLFKEACAKAEELTYLEPDFRLIPLSDGFNFDAFYHTFISRVTGKDEDDVIAPKPVDLTDSDKVQKLTEQLLRQDFSHRALAYLTMEISEKVKFGIGVYNFTRKKTEPTSVKLDRVTKQQIESRRAYKYGQMPEGKKCFYKSHFESIKWFLLDPEDADLERTMVLNDILTANKTIKYLDVGGEKVKFTPLEVNEMKQVMQPKLKLLGFKPLSVFKQDLHIKNPRFIYPSDKAIKGSTAIFRALWEACIRNDKFALCIFLMRYKSLPRVVALIPEQENLATNTYDGFRLEFMPYASDIRDLSKLYCAEESSPEMVTACTNVISKCQVQYSPSMIKNPVNDKIFSLIECSVFNEEKTPIDDHSKPNVEQQDARIGKFVEELKEMVDGFEEVAVSKRKGSISENGNNAKKPAVEINKEMILEKCQSGDVKHVTVPMLKEFLKQANVSGISKMGKDDLIAKILELNP